MKKICLSILLLTVTAAAQGPPVASNAQTVRRANASATRVVASRLDTEIRDFTAREIAAHFRNIKTMDPPPDRVFNAQTVGDFSWGSFARALAAQADIGGQRTIAGKGTARAIAEMGLHESRQGGKSFAQLYSTLALRHYGTDLSKNAVWQSMNEAERREWHSLLDPTRFYDAKNRAVINLPENYLGVAARVAAMSFQMGILKDRAFLDSVVEKAAEQFTNGAIYADDNPPTGRYDRYSNEYARFCWDAADIAGRNDIKEKLKPSLKQQMKLWWDLVSPAGYGYNWGRSQGLVSYLDTLEIVAFLGANPEFRPAPITELAALYNQAWNWLKADYNPQTHMFRVFDYGRGNYSYINPSREWQQTGTGLGKIILAHETLMKALDAEKVTSFPDAPTLPNVARFEFFAKGEKQEGVWLFRRGNVHFALPITVGTKPAISDYLPVPYGVPGFAPPVEEVYPALVPFITLADGKVYAASDGADEIIPAADGMSLQIVNKKWARVGSKSGERFPIGLTSHVSWRVDGNRLTRREVVEAEQDVSITKWRVALSSTASAITPSETNKKFVLSGREGKLGVTVDAPFATPPQIQAVGDSELGKGVLGAIPIHLVLTSGERQLRKGEKLVWEISLEIVE